MPRSRQLATRLRASERHEAWSSPETQARLISSTSARCSSESRSSQFGGFRFRQAFAATASRRLDEAVAEAVEDAGDVSAALGDRLLADLRKAGVEGFMHFCLQAGTAFEPRVDENLASLLWLLGIRPERPASSGASQTRVPPQPDAAGNREVVISSHSNSLHK